MYDIQLSPHFKLSEFVRSGTATNKGIDNTPTLTIVSNLQYLCQTCLEPLRAFANRPIFISSGFRCPALNKAVGGVSSSNHLSGYAADIYVPSNEIGELWFNWMKKNLPVFDELITERSTQKSASFWIHLAIRQGGTNRKKVIHNLIKNK